MKSARSQADKRREQGERRLLGRLVLLGLLVCSWVGLCSWALSARAALAAGDRLSELQKTLRANQSPGQRRQAAVELGKLGEAAAVPALIQALLADRSEAVRAACAESLGQLGEVGARSALKAAAHDESNRVQRLASAALSRIEERAEEDARPVQKVSVIIGRMGSKAKSGTLSDIPKRLRETVTKELSALPEIDIAEEGKKPTGPGKLFLVESSVTNLARRTTPSGELEISCDISVVIALMPGHNIVGIVSGGASAFGPRGPSTKPTKALIENLETQALTQAVQAANENLVSFLRAQSRAPTQ